MNLLNLFRGRLTTKRALQLLEGVPEEKFTTGAYTRQIEEKCCSLGHFSRLTSINPNNFSYSNCSRPDIINRFADKTYKFIVEKYKERANLASVNDDKGVNGYIEETPKKRVIHLLKDMIAAGY